ncbi:MAG: peptide chain release factor N(5)-glutamine methyltransferase [Oscillospiraceae bacterium]|nr:peptide chain release factor N(5)-glutamine methyltransferase [Oscillospiraceae bacterium]
MKTYNELYISARRRLKSAGIEGYGLEAQLLAAAAAGKTRTEFFRDMTLYSSPEYERDLDELIERRLRGEPVAYITGQWEFYGLPLKVNQEVLIPRIDTEVLADMAIDYIRRGGGGGRILDLCCGSGCVGLALAANLPDIRVVMIDRDPSVLAVSRANVNLNRQPRRVSCADGDALKTPPIFLGKFDMIVCNPPYIPSGDIESLDRSVKDYEPRMALDGGEDGLMFYRSVSSKWKILLTGQARLMFECGVGQAEAVAEIMRENGFENIETFKDTLDIDRVVTGTLKEEERNG